MDTKICTRCGALKPVYEFSPIKSKPGKRRPECRACNAARHGDQPATTDGVRKGRAIIAERFGGVDNIPLGCIVQVRGHSPQVCAFYRKCAALPVDATVYCEVDDAELSIPLHENVKQRVVSDGDGPWWFPE